MIFCPNFVEFRVQKRSLAVCTTVVQLGIFQLMSNLQVVKVRYVIFSITVMTKFLFIGIFVSLLFVSSFSRSI